MADDLACIDTDICIDFLRKVNPGFDLFTKLISQYKPCITAITTFELHLGQMKMKRRDDLSDFFKHFSFLPFDYQASEAAASIQSKLDKKGSGIGIPDVLIAGICIANNVPLLTLNKRHFSRITELKLLSFP